MSPATAWTLLLVEDNPGDAHLIEELLAVGLEPPRVLHVETLSDAAAVLHARTVDAVLLDLRLPDGAGVDCVDRVLAWARDVPIVVLTGVDDDALALGCIRAGAQDYLSKHDVRATTLRRAIGYAIARSREASAQRRADLSQARLAAIVEASRDAIVSTTLDGVVTTWNAGAELVFGYTRDDAIGRPLHEVVPTEPGSEPGPEPGSEPREVVARRSDGRRLDLSVVWCDLPDRAGNLLGRAGIFRDITEHKRLEMQLVLSDRMVTIGTLAAGVAHEINNPLAAMVANVELALAGLAGREARAGRDEGPGDIVEALSIARDAGARVRHIVRDLNVFSRGQDEQRGPVYVAAVIASCLRMARNEIEPRARLITDLPATPPVLANEARLGQVILNLLVNAAQAIDAGDRDRNEICVRTGTDARGWVTVTITDTGAGISPRAQARLFTPFFTTKPVGDGTGLGLAISHRIVTALGGRIRLDSRPGEPTVASIALPPTRPAVSDDVAGPAPDPGPGRAPDPATPPPPARRGRVLVIDDDEMIATTMRRVLEPLHDVDVVDSGTEGLARLRGEPTYDLVICDLMMPRLTGAELYEEVRRLGRDLESRIVFMTGGAFTPSARRFLESVDNPCIAKPFDPFAVRALVADLLAGQPGA